MEWIILILAGLGEVVGVMGLNLWNARRNAASLALLAAGFAASFLLLSLAMRDISMGTAYAIWTGIGTVGATLVGMLVYGESRQWCRIFFLALVVGSAVGLKFVGEG
ncbi:QacE family quaternary ammonium compound efflux SMR transporter [Cohnella xylanilytica]|uniref:DMT family transporter n=1 Tax=Cohnella xylanilytica TaxID=557555 RepID=UPI001AFDD72F|nr:multidrug efflux SMR transporter [Cohnella xylanilytica]GIO12322.1 QacE family quaternary ammonium compound efflux SMR transporter [Cohnella xylanilytica]